MAGDGLGSGQIRPGAGSPFGAGYSPGGIGLRLGALLIDAAFVFATVILTDLLIAVVGGPGTDTTPAAMAISLLWLFFVLSYHPASWYVFDCTIGQRALGLRVRRRSDGQSLGFGAVNIRYIVFCVETLIFPLGIIARRHGRQRPDEADLARRSRRIGRRQAPVGAPSRAHGQRLLGRDRHVRGGLAKVC